MSEDTADMAALRVRMDNYGTEQTRQRDSVHKLLGHATALIGATDRHEKSIDTLNGQVAELLTQTGRHEESIRSAERATKDVEVGIRAVETKVDGIARVVPAIDRLIALIPAIETLQRLVPSLEALAAERQVLRDEFRLKRSSNWVAWGGLLIALVAFARGAGFHVSMGP